MPAITQTIVRDCPVTSRYDKSCRPLPAVMGDFMDFYFLALILGRIFIGGIFILAGIQHFQHFDPPLAIMKGRGVLYAAPLLVAGSVWEIVLGAFVVTGFWAVPAALGLILFLVPATIIFHNFWDHEGIARVHHMHVVMTNVMVAGGLLALVAAMH
jgi:putative oxidoreductase